MATYKTLQDSTLSPNSLYLTCDICGSADIVDTRGGYVCRECGIVLEVQKLQYDRPYNEEKLQHARGLGKTKIGTKHERGISPHSRSLSRLNKQNRRIGNEEAVFERASIEIARIFHCLDRSDFNMIKEMVFHKFQKVRPEFRPGLKYRNTKKLVAILTYFCLKSQNVSVNCQQVIEVSDLTKKEFNDFCIQVRRYPPEYFERNRQEYILTRVLEITEQFNLGMPFYRLAERILDKLWHTIKSTTDDVVAGLVSAISLLCHKIEHVSVNAICTRLGIRMSTVQAQVKKRVFKRFKVDGFVSLIRSSDLLVQTIEKLGLIEISEEEEPGEFDDSDGSVELVFGSVAEVFNRHNTRDYYYFALRGDNNSLVIIAINIHDIRLSNDSEPYSEARSLNLLDCTIFKYFSKKGPPSMGEV